jgi:hypothetical protein
MNHATVITDNVKALLLNKILNRTFVEEYLVLKNCLTDIFFNIIQGTGTFICKNGVFAGDGRCSNITFLFRVSLAWCLCIVFVFLSLSGLQTAS